MKRITYDKTKDNYLASFGSEVKESEMARIIDILINHRKVDSFNVSNFLSIYYDYENNLRFEKLFHKNNAKKDIDNYLKNLKENRFIYNQSDRRWFKE